MQITTSLRVIISLAATLSGGCSLLVDTDPYLGQADADVAVDAPISSDAPSSSDAPTTPEIHIDPASPRTTDALVVVIDRASVDPLMGTVEYEYRWLRDGSTSDESGSTLTAEQTSRGETWRVEVTPIAEPGARRGAAASAEVTIENTPPRLTALGLETYEPRVGEMLRAVPGFVIDDDGDSAGLRFQWYRGAAPIEGATTATLDTTGLAVGDELRVEAWAHDGDDGPSVSLGPVAIAADRTHWRQLLPDQPSQLHVVWDAPHDRAIRLIDSEPWEYFVAGDGRLRIVRLAAPGDSPAPLETTWVMHDEGNRRLLAMSRADAGAVYALDLSRRGQELWTRITPGGSPPNVQNAAVVHYDAHNERVWIFGGFDDSDDVGALDQIFSLDVASPGAETWTEHAPTGTFPRIFAAGVAADPSVPGRIYLFGGLTTPTPASITTRREIVRADLTDTTVTVSEISATMPSPAFGVAAATDRANARIVLIGGLSAFSPTATDVPAQSFDPATGVFSPIPGPSAATIYGVAHPDSIRPGHFVVAGAGGDVFADEMYLQLLDVAADDITVRAADLRPVGLISPIARMSLGTIRIFGGRGSAGVRDDAWTLDPTTLEWTLLETRPDEVTGLSPAGRFGMVGESSNGIFAGGDFVVVGGELDDRLLADMRGWTLDLGGRWIEHSLRAGTASIAARTGHAVIDAECAALGVFGGEDLAGTLRGDTALLRCTSARDCEWSTGTTGTVPSARSFATLVSVRENGAWLFGGRTASGPVADVHRLDTCAPGAGAWTRITPTGPPPAARYAHSTTAVIGPIGLIDSLLVFGGTAGDEPFDDVHQLMGPWDAPPRWAPLAVEGLRPSGRSQHVALWDATRGRLLVIGGQDRTGSRSDVWELRIRP
ncbi:MAG: hypothetical protein M3Y87_06165 [Myxococcota bacterium]|nr:hypothetical protein [Myxococcota bacterium]